MIRELKSLFSTKGQFKCRHNWKIERDYLEHKDGYKPTILKCEKCGVVLTAHEAAEIELWKNTTGFQRWIAIVALLLSTVSLSVVFLNTFLQNAQNDSPLNISQTVSMPE